MGNSDREICKKKHGGVLAARRAIGSRRRRPADRDFGLDAPAGKSEPDIVA
jgi:hypothetical protein